MFRNIGVNVPKDIRTILHTPTLHPIIDIQNGKYLHLGFSNMIEPYLKKLIKIIPNNIILKLSFNIDGLPLARSSKTQFWPI